MYQNSEQRNQNSLNLVSRMNFRIVAIVLPTLSVENVRCRTNDK